MPRKAPPQQLAQLAKDGELLGPLEDLAQSDLTFAPTIKGITREADEAARQAFMALRATLPAEHYPLLLAYDSAVGYQLVMHRRAWLLCGLLMNDLGSLLRSLLSPSEEN